MDFEKIKGFFAPFLQSLSDWCKASHQNYVIREQQRIYYERLNRIQCQQDKVQQELALVLQNFNYPKMVQVNSITDLRQDGYKVENGRVIYYFTIDKTVWETFPIAICNIIRQSMNKDIFTFQRNLRVSYFIEEITSQYPVLYSGLTVINVENQKIWIRLAVITNMPL